MRMWGPINVFDEGEEESIHRTILRILDEVGVCVESEQILERLAQAGGRIDRKNMRACFSSEFMERFIGESEVFDWDSAQPRVWGVVGMYCGYYLDPETDRYEPWTVRTMLRYAKIAHYLEHTNGEISYAFPVEGVPNEVLVPFFHYLALKFTGRSACSLNNVRWCPLVLEMCETAADALGVPAGKLFNGHIHLISPLKLGREEARIFTFFAERGLRVGIGNMSSAGGTAPVTLAGAIALHLAQGMFINILMRAYFGQKHIGLGCSISPLDMRTAMYAYGRPEKEICNVAMAQMARRYGASYAGHGGLCDAKRPGAEAAFQKAMNSIPTLMACGHTAIDCGLLSVDEVFSPIQMVIDDEMVSALGRFARGFEVNEDTLAFDLIKEVGPGGWFLDAEHTARHFRAEQWEPRLFTRQMFAAWERSGAKSEVDLATETYCDIARREPLPVRIPDSGERALLDIIRRGTGVEIQPVEPE